jgi:heme/copper-type cytochrome/quinol oxidase subunit 2
MNSTKRGRRREILRSVGISLGMAIATLAALEIFLRVVDFRALRQGSISESSLRYGHDAEIGWIPVPGSSSIVTGVRTFRVQHNSLSLRDIEFNPDAKPTIMFLGDSFVWGFDVEANERFTELLRARISSHKIVAAGVSGYGTDQEYLLLQRLWPKIQPSVVVLIFCTANDRADNSANKSSAGYQKPYFATAPDGSLLLKGQPVPKSHQQLINEDWLTRNLWLARLAYTVYEVRDSSASVPDPTERLVGRIRDFVEANGAKFLVGLQKRDPALIEYLEANRIPFVTFDGAASYGPMAHWTPEGQKFVADHAFRLLSENNILKAGDRAPE